MTNESFPAENKQPLSFDNTAVAFAGKSDKELTRAYWIFKIINNKFLSAAGPSLTNFALKIHLPVTSFIRKTIFEQFCGGESIEQCEPVIDKLAKAHVGTILDYSVEDEEREPVFINTAEEIIRTIRRASGDRRIPFTVFKVTALARFELLKKIDAEAELTVAEQAEFFKVKARVNQICKTAFDCSVPVLIDAEESWIQNTIDNLALDMMRLYNRKQAIVYNTYQLYRKDKLASLKADIYLAETDNFILGAKLVRGAYMEKERQSALKFGYPSPIYDNKAYTDAAYNDALKFCIEHLSHAAFVAGTHNEESVKLLIGLIEQHFIPKNHPHVYFAQLLGMSDNLSFNLGDARYNVAKYVPYGPVKAVIPYLFRRAEENKSIAGNSSRELSLIKKEKQRRRI